MSTRKVSEEIGIKYMKYKRGDFGNMKNKNLEKYDAKTLNEIGITYYENREYEKAEERYLAAIEKGSVEALYNLALLYHHLDRIEEAENY